jgi:hypothetical protein
MAAIEQRPSTTACSARGSSLSACACASAIASAAVCGRYWKPVGVTSTVDRGDATNVLAASGVERAYRGQRLFNVGRLDKETTGLLLLTSDGRLPGAALAAEARQEKVRGHGAGAARCRRVATAAVAERSRRRCCTPGDAAAVPERARRQRPAPPCCTTAARATSLDV